uniref:Fatty acid-binding protein E n=1 Tax=Brachionus plicatilis TaxID=10195 RepID=A0AA49KFG7_BRAPC|nr:fatty acid-binding protein E [Brachionus plicatilis]
MQSALIGTWELESSENINEYFKQLGMAANRRKVAVTIKPTVVISKSDDDLWCIAIDMKNKGTETVFRVDNEVDSSNELKYVFDIRFYFDSRKRCRSVFHFENANKLIQKMHFIDTEENQVIVREIDSEGNLIELMEMNGVKARRIFKRI